MAKVTWHARQQGQRLRQLRERLGLSQPLVADRLSFKTTQGVDLYERGVSVLRLDMVPRWAEAFGITEQEFVSAVLGNIPAPEWSLEDALRAGGLSEHDVQDGLDAAHDLGDLDSRAFAAAWVRACQRTATLLQDNDRKHA